MKCYLTQDINGEHQELVFAQKRPEAVLKSEAYQWEGDYINVRATREPEFDKYADQGYVPKQVLLNNGWWFECYGRKAIGRCCKPLTIEDNPLVVNEHVYCGHECLDNAGSEISVKGRLESNG